MKRPVGLFLAAVAGVSLDKTNAFTTVSPLALYKTTTTQLDYNKGTEDAFRDRLNTAYEDWCQLHGRTPEASRKEIFGYHFLLAERFFQNTGVRLELNEHAHLTDQEYAGILGLGLEAKLKRPPAMEAEHQRFQAAYAEWCDANNKQIQQDRLEIFSYHHLMAERYLEETGTTLQLNEYADRTQEEYELILQPPSPTQEKEPTTAKSETLPPQQDFRTKDWWDSSGTSSNFADWFEGSSSLTSAGYERPRSAKSRWQEAAKAADTITPKEASSQDFWVGDNAQGSVPPATTKQPQNSIKDATSTTVSSPTTDQTPQAPSKERFEDSSSSAQGSVGPSSTSSYAEPDVPEMPLSATSSTTKDAASPSSMTSYVQDPAPTSRLPAQLSQEPPTQEETLSGKGAGDWWGSGSIAQMKPITDHTDMSKRAQGSPGGEARAPRITSTSKTTTTNPAKDGSLEDPLSSPPPLDSPVSSDAVSSPPKDVSLEDSSSSPPPLDSPVSSDPVSSTDDKSKNYLDTLHPVQSVGSFSSTAADNTAPDNNNNIKPKSYLDTLHPVPSFQGPSESSNDGGSSFVPGTIRTESSDDWWTKASISPDDPMSHLEKGEGVEAKLAQSTSQEEEEEPLVIPASLDVKDQVEEEAELVESTNKEKPPVIPSSLNVKDQKEEKEAKLAKSTSQEEEPVPPGIPSSLNLLKDDKNDVLEQEYVAWCQEYDKEPNDARRKIFVRNSKWAREYSEKSGVELEMNEYADLTEDEFQQVLAAEEEEEPVKPLEVVSSDGAGDMSSVLSGLGLSTEEMDEELKEEQPIVLSGEEEAKPLDVVSVDDGAGPSDKSSVLSSRKQRKKDMYEFQERLLATKLRNEIKLREQTKILAAQLAKYFFQRRLLAARIEYDAKAKELEKAKKKSAFQQKLLSERIKNDLVASQQRAEEKKVRAAAAIRMEKAKKESAFQQALLGERIKNDFIASQQRTKEKKVSSGAPRGGDSQKETKESEPTSVPSAATRSTDGSVVSISSTDELVFEYTSPYQGLTGPSKAGLVLAALLAVGMVATSPELDFSSQVDWSQIDVTDFAALSGTAQHAIQDFVHNVQDGFAGATKGLSEATTQNGLKDFAALSGTAQHAMQDFVHNVQEGFTGASKGLSEGAAQNGLKDFVHNIQEGFVGATKSLSEGIHAASQKFMGGLESMKESTSRSVESMGERMSAPKSDHTNTLKGARDSLSGWKADRAQNIQDIGKAAEKSTRVLKESTVSNVKDATNTIKEVKQNTPSVIKEIKSSTTTNVMRELKQSPATSVIKEVKPRTAAKIIKDVAPSSSTTDLKSMLSDWNAQQ